MLTFKKKFDCLDHNLDPCQWICDNVGTFGDPIQSGDQNPHIHTWLPNGSKSSYIIFSKPKDLKYRLLLLKNIPGPVKVALQISSLNSFTAIQN